MGCHSNYVMYFAGQFECSQEAFSMCNPKLLEVSVPFLFVAPKYGYITIYKLNKLIKLIENDSNCSLSKLNSVHVAIVSDMSVLTIC